MNQVILLTDRPEECETLISCLKILFPEFEVQVQPKQADNLQRMSLLQNLPHLKNNGGKQWVMVKKHLQMTRGDPR